MLQPGQRLDDYQIINFFESGGMGEIYLAEEMSLGRQVVIKVIRPEAIKYPNSEEARKTIQLFRREATAIARLNHPYILPLYRFGRATIDANPLMYMVMPYCQERSLLDWMYTHGKTILSPQEVDYILRQAAEALQYAHDQGIIHLDVKPTNFLVRYQAGDFSRLNLQLTDFGIAKFAATTGMSQTVRGSLEYMAPEQWESQPVFATDQYALAIMVYRLLTGQSPFNGSSFEQLWHQHRFSQPLPPSAVNRNIPPSIDAVLLRAMAKNPNDRYPSVIAFADAYRQAILHRQSPTEYASIRQMLTLSPEEASRGTIRTFTLPSGEPLSVTIPPGAFQGQILTYPRQYAPTVVIGIQISSVSVQFPQPFTPYYSSSSSWNGTSSVSAPTVRSKTRLFILAGSILILLIGIGVFIYSNYYPNIQGTYTGSFQFSTGGTPTQLTLYITQQNQQRFEGTCTTVNSLFGTNNFTLESGTVDKSGNIRFTFTGTNFVGTILIRTFIGTSQSGGGWQGTFSDTGGNAGTWSVM